MKALYQKKLPAMAILIIEIGVAALLFSLYLLCIYLTVKSALSADPKPVREFIMPLVGMKLLSRSKKVRKINDFVSNIKLFGKR